MERYLIGTPTTAVRTRDGQKDAFLLPGGSVVETPTSIEGKSGLVEVSLDGESIVMFAEDIQQRGRVISS